jgi:hypothetical protein
VIINLTRAGGELPGQLCGQIRGHNHSHHQQVGNLPIITMVADGCINFGTWIWVRIRRKGWIRIWIYIEIKIQGLWIRIWSKCRGFIGSKWSRRGSEDNSSQIRIMLKWSRIGIRIKVIPY